MMICLRFIEPYPNNNNNNRSLYCRRNKTKKFLTINYDLKFIPTKKAKVNTHLGSREKYEVPMENTYNDSK